MEPSSGRNKPAEGKPVPGLLPWQILLVFAITGLFAAQYPLAGLVTVCLLLCYLWTRCREHPAFFVAVVVVFTLGIGLSLHSLSKPLQKVPDWMKAREKVELLGTVHKLSPKPNDRLQITLRELRFRQTGTKEFQRLPGRCVWTWEEPSRYPAPGQEVQALFRLKPIHGRQNFGAWDSRGYWARKKVLYRTYSQGEKTPIELQGPVTRFWSLRMSLRETIIRNTKTGPGQGLMLALLMGDRSKISYQTLDLVRRASLAHSLALSGLHLGFVVTLAYGLTWLAGRIKPSLYLWLPRHKLAILAAIPLVLVYLWLGQARPSLLRAALMFFFWGFLTFKGRLNVFADAICFALLLILIANPLSVHDLGLQLSIVAVAGIVIYLPLVLTWTKGLERRIGWGKALTPALVLLGVSLIANLVLLPLIVRNFGELSLHLYFNLLWLPLLGVVVLPLGFIGLGLSLIPGLSLPGGLFLLAGAEILEGMVWILQFFEQKNWLSVLVPLRPLWPEMLGYWVLVLALPRSLNRIGALPKWIPVCGLVLLLAPGLTRTIGGLKHTLSLEMIDVGQGQSILLEAGKGTRLLLDGGGSWNREYDLGRFILSPALTWGKAPRLDQVVLSHDDYDHLRGLFYILKHYQVENFCYNGNWPAGEDGQLLREIIENRRIKVRQIQAGDLLRLNPGLNLKILHPPGSYQTEKDNDRSLVLRLSHEDKGLALLPGDIEEKGLRLLCAGDENLQSEVLVIPHHGSRSSFYPPLYRLVEPDLALVSCGYLNFFHFPHQTILDALGKGRIPLFSTAANGQISVNWDLDAAKRSIRTKIPAFHVRP